MKRTYKNVYGDGRVEYVDFEIDDPEPPTEEQALTRYANELTGASDPDLISAAETLITERIKEES